MKKIILLSLFMMTSKVWAQYDPHTVSEQVLLENKILELKAQMEELKLEEDKRLNARMDRLINKKQEMENNFQVRMKWGKYFRIKEKTPIKALKLFHTLTEGKFRNIPSTEISHSFQLSLHPSNTKEKFIDSAYVVSEVATFVARKLPNLGMEQELKIPTFHEIISDNEQARLEEEVSFYRQNHPSTSMLGETVLPSLITIVQTNRDDRNRKDRDHEDVSIVAHPTSEIGNL